MTRTPIVAGNWKMHHGPNGARATSPPAVPAARVPRSTGSSCPCSSSSSRSLARGMPAPTPIVKSSGS